MKQHVHWLLVLLVLTGLLLGIHIGHSLSDSPGDWTLDGWATYRDWCYDDWQTIQPEVWGPARIVDNLPYSSADTTSLTSILDGMHYTKTYSYDVTGKTLFACGTTSEILWYILTNCGYNTKIMQGNMISNDITHAWVLVEFEDGYIPIETTRSYSKCLGAIVSPDDVVYFGGGGSYTTKNYMRGMMSNSSQEYNIYTMYAECLCSTLEYKLPVVVE